MDYPKEYRPKADYQKLKREILTGWDKNTVFGAFDITSGKMVSYSVFERHTSYIKWSVLKSDPAYEKLKINAAIIAYSLEFFNEDISNGIYIVDGERNISHQTAFQDYLIRTFGFRKAYCKIHVVYRPVIRQIINILYPIRNVFVKFPGRLAHNVNAILQMEYIRRNQGAVEKGLTNAG